MLHPAGGATAHVPRLTSTLAHGVAQSVADTVSALPVQPTQRLTHNALPAALRSRVGEAFHP